MNKAYIILAHRYPQHLIRMIRQLDDGNSCFYVHIDSSADISRFPFFSPAARRIMRLERLRTRWAGFDLVQATLNGLVAVLNSGRPVDRIILLSGQDYPIKSNEQIDAFFRDSPFSIFLEHTLIPDYRRWEPRGGQYRLDKYYFGLHSSQRLAGKAMNFLSCLPLGVSRKAPKHLKPYAGSQWWVIDQYAAEYILRYLREHPEYVRFHRHTFAPDELFFHMILLNSDDPRIAGAIVNDNLRFFRWPDSGLSHPEVLGSGDLEALRSSQALFARKFDPDKQPEIIDAIDQYCLKSMRYEKVV